MSFPPWQDPTNPANPESHHWQWARNQEVKRWPSTPGDWILTGSIVGLFALGILYTLIVQHFR